MPEQRLDLAGAILDGARIDWAAVESTSDAAEWELLSRLKILETVAEFHRRAPWLPSADEGPLATLRARPAAGAEPWPEAWGHLRLLDRIGEGGFGQVYRAWDPWLDREVALKLLPAARCRMSGSESSVIHEGRLLARVRHPNVVTIHGAEQIGETVGLWMELVNGKTFADLLDQGQTFSTSEATEICLELCGALSAVHEAGLLHGDIKAHNVMRANDGRIVLMDFGAGRELDDSSLPSGTPAYLAPEILAGKPATIRSDIYSLGVLLFHLVTGTYPVTGRTLRELRAAHERGRRVSVSLTRADLHPSLTRVIDRAIDPDPDRRHPTADALAADLRVQNDDAVAADMRVLRRRPGIGAIVLGISVTAVLVVAVALPMMLMRFRPSEPPTLPAQITAQGGLQPPSAGATQVPAPTMPDAVPAVQPQALSPVTAPGALQSTSADQRGDRLRVRISLEEAKALADQQVKVPWPADISTASEAVAKALLTVAQTQQRAGDVSGASKTYDLAARRFRELRDFEAERSTRQTMVTMLARQGDLVEAEREGRWLLEADRNAKNLPALAADLTDISIISYRQGKNAAVTMLDESRTLARSIGSRALEAGANHALGQLYGQLGSLGPISELATSALSLYREASRPDGIASTLTTLGLARLNAGDLDAARRTLEEAAAISLSVSPEHQAVAARLALARAVLALEESRLQDARTLALRAASVFRAERLRDDEASAHEVMALISLASRNVPDAQAQIAQAEKLLVGQDFLCRMSVGITAARVLAATRRPQDLAAAHRTLLDLRNRASGLQYVLLEYEVRLALHEVELALANARPGPLGPAEFEAEARKMGQALLAGKVAAVVAGRPSVSGVRSLGLMVR
jgi:tetratricopeptide (TPR) repeat protein